MPLLTPPSDPHTPLLPFFSASSYIIHFTIYSTPSNPYPPHTPHVLMDVRVFQVPPPLFTIISTSLYSRRERTFTDTNMSVKQRVDKPSY